MRTQLSSLCLSLLAPFSARVSLSLSLRAPLASCSLRAPLSSCSLRALVVLSSCASRSSYSLLSSYAPFSSSSRLAPHSHPSLVSRPIPSLVLRPVRAPFWPFSRLSPRSCTPFSPNSRSFVDDARMLAPALVMLLLLAVATVWLMFYYGSRRKITVAVFIITFVGWYFPFSIVFLVPLDVLSVRVHPLHDTVRRERPRSPCRPPVAPSTLVCIDQLQQLQRNHLDVRRAHRVRGHGLPQLHLEHQLLDVVPPHLVRGGRHAPPRPPSRAPRAHLPLARSLAHTGFWRRSCRRTPSRAGSRSGSGAGTRSRRTSSSMPSSVSSAPARSSTSASPTRWTCACGGPAGRTHTTRVDRTECPACWTRCRFPGRRC